MRIDLQSAALRLRRGKAIRVRDGAGNMLQVLEGLVWLTEENSPRDVVLKPGERFRLASPGLAIVEAFSDASIIFSGTES